MDSRRKLNNKLKFHVFAGKLDSLLARGKVHPRKSPTPQATPVSTPDTAASASGIIAGPFVQSDPNLLSFSPRQSVLIRRAPINREHSQNRPERYQTVNENRRRQLIREMIERNKMARQLTENSSTRASNSGRSIENNAAHRIVVVAPRPPPRSTPESRLKYQRARSIDSILSSPMTSSLSSPSPAEEQTTSSTPDLSPPESPDLINFPDSDEEAEQDVPIRTVPVQAVPVVDSVGDFLSDPVIITTGSSGPSLLDQDIQEQDSPWVQSDNRNRTESEQSLSASNNSLDILGSMFSSTSLNVSASASSTSLIDYPTSTIQFGSPESGTSRESRGPTGPGLESDLSFLSRASSSSSGISSVSYDSTPGGLKVSDKIVWFTENGSPETGVVRWIGKINDRFHAGVEFENPVGNSSGKLKGRRLFTTALTHGRFIPVSELMFHEDFYTPKVSNSNQPSKYSNGIPDLTKDSDYEPMPFVCVICQEDLLTRDESSKDKESTKEMLTTKCGHLFHSDCLNKWFSTKKKVQQPCPYCQFMMNISDTIRIFPVQGKH